jgi:hypothetical protein
VHVPRFRTRHTGRVQECEAQFAGGWIERLSLHARLVVCHAIVGQAQAVGVEVVDGDHGVGRAHFIALKMLDYRRVAGYDLIAGGGLFPVRRLAFPVAREALELCECSGGVGSIGLVIGPHRRGHDEQQDCC